MIVFRSLLDIMVFCVSSHFLSFWHKKYGSVDDNVKRKLPCYEPIILINEQWPHALSSKSKSKRTLLTSFLTPQCRHPSTPPAKLQFVAIPVSANQPYRVIVHDDALPAPQQTSPYLQQLFLRHFLQPRPPNSHKNPLFTRGCLQRSTMLCCTIYVLERLTKL
jgi:hypothetical protein